MSVQCLFATLIFSMVSEVFHNSSLRDSNLIYEYPMEFAILNLLHLTVGTISVHPIDVISMKEPNNIKIHWKARHE